MLHLSSLFCTSIIFLLLCCSNQRTHAQLITNSSRVPFFAIDTPSTPPPEIELLSSSDPSTGYIFLSCLDVSVPSAQSHLLIINNNGKIHRQQFLTTRALDFHPQPNGQLTYFSAKDNMYYVLDSNFTTIRTIHVNTEYTTDNHELLILPNGHYFLLAKENHYVNMTAFGGQESVMAVGNVVLEFDELNNKVFEWKTRDHYNVSDATHEDLTQGVIFYSHLNSIEIDHDSNILVSSRHLDEITKINRNSGKIMWRFGGKHNQFTLIGDSIMFSHPHTIRKLPNGNYILFDNGNFNSPQVSRVCEYRIDTASRTATLVWQYRHPANLFAASMGSVQPLPNGNILIGWGAETRVAVTEVDRQGNIKLEFKMSLTNISYRAYRYEWDHIPQPISVEKIYHSPLQFSIYPNPTMSSMFVNYSLDEENSVQLTIEDYLGNTIRSFREQHMSKGSHLFNIDLSSIPPGAYFVRIRIGNKQNHKKLIIQ